MRTPEGRAPVADDFINTQHRDNLLQRLQTREPLQSPVGPSRESLRRDLAVAQEEAKRLGAQLELERQEKMEVASQLEACERELLKARNRAMHTRDKYDVMKNKCLRLALEKKSLKGLLASAEQEQHLIQELERSLLQESMGPSERTALQELADTRKSYSASIQVLQENLQRVEEERDGMYPCWPELVGSLAAGKG